MGLLIALLGSVESHCPLGSTSPLGPIHACPSPRPQVTTGLILFFFFFLTTGLILQDHAWFLQEPGVCLFH